MMPVTKITERSLDYALVSFIRSSVMSPTQIAEVWDSETPIGEMKPRSFIQYKATPGKHLFLAKAEQSDKWSYIEANLITGEHYVVKLEVTPGGYAARFVMKPLSPKRGDSDVTEIKEWLTDLKGRKMIDGMVEYYQNTRGASVKQAINAYKEGKMIPEILAPEDFWPDSI